MKELPVLRERGSCCEVEPAIPSAEAEDAAGALRVLGDPIRLSMLATLRTAGAPVCVCDFTATYGVTQPTISHHMGKLRRAGLVEARKEGVWTYYSAVRPLPPLVEAVLSSLSTRSAA